MNSKEHQSEKISCKLYCVRQIFSLRQRNSYQKLSEARKALGMRGLSAKSSKRKQHTTALKRLATCPNAYRNSEPRGWITQS